ncbi:unnamed protein product [Rotaria magnacalcarata]|uniref:Peptidase A2 domain-containing protein n=2 Tax=Rotaria magnacalcarata TaxID=392030 RepID=A0A8S2XEQ8_9BILA|nr:unnamed protein product [Rotaria magnacalcarata]
MVLSKKRRWSARWTGPWRSKLTYPVQLSAEIHTVNINNTNPLTLFGMIAGRRTQLLIDSGASLTLINLHFFLQLPKYYRKKARLPPSNLCLQLADRSQLYVKYALSLPITISNSTRMHRVYVVPKLWRSCIIGNDLIHKHNLQIDGGRQYAYFKTKNIHTQVQQERKEKVNNDDEYILLANERIKISPFHAFNIEVKPNKPFSVIEEKNEEDEYEVTSIKETPCVANGIIAPNQYITLQVANLTKRMIIIHPNQPLATMTRLNQSQINMMQHGKISSTSNQTKLTAENEPNLINTDLDEHQKKEIRKLIHTFPDVFNEQAGRTKKLQHRINLVPDMHKRTTCHHFDMHQQEKKLWKKI